MRRAGPAEPDHRPPRHAALVDDLERGFARAAASAGGSVDRDFDLADARVRLRFAGQRLAGPMTLPLAHAEADGHQAGAEPDFTVDIWDSESTTVPPPEVRWGNDDYREHGTIRGFFGDGLYAIFQWGSRSLLVLDADRCRGWFWAESASKLGMLDLGSPLRTLFNLWLWRCAPGRQLLHAAAVGRSDGCALIVGSAGAGKSSTALACLDSELMLIGDDYCVARRGDPPVISTLYSSAKADEATLARLPALREMLAPAYTPETEKVILDLNSHVPAKLLASAPLRAVLIPRVTGRPETTSDPCSGGEALAALAPSTMLQLPGSDEDTLAGLREIVGSVPCHRLAVGTDPSLIPPEIEKALALR
jgi:hypothetical protein